MTEDKKTLVPEVRTLVDDISQRFRAALSWLGQEKQGVPIEHQKPSETGERSDESK